MQSRARRMSGFTLIELMIVIAILAAILVPNFIRARAQGQLTACKSNCKNIATALEMYSQDNAGRFPAGGGSSLSALTPNYLKSLPTCPSTGTNTYSSAYSASSSPDSYQFSCLGANHTAAGMSRDYPKYTSAEGLVER